MGQGVAHLLRPHLVQRVIPDGVLFGEQVGKELGRQAEVSRSTHIKHSLKLDCILPLLPVLEHEYGKNGFINSCLNSVTFESLERGGLTTDANKAFPKITEL